MKSPKFKIGDEVICTGENKGEYKSKHYRGFGWELGKAFKVISITKENIEHNKKYFGKFIYFDNKSGVYEKSLEGIGLEYLIKRTLEKEKRKCQKK